MSFEALRHAAKGLDPERVTLALARCFEDWRRPDSPWLTRLCERQRLFSVSALERGVILGLERWDEPALRRWLSGERAACARGPELSAAIVAGAIPTNAFALVAAPLLAGSSVFAHVPEVDPHTLPLFRESLEQRDPVVSAALELGDVRPHLRRFDAVIVEGSDQTLADVRASLAPRTLFVGYGHKLSVAVIGRGACLPDAARALALDIALFDGRGCLSPAFVWVVDDPAGRASELAVLLASELAGLAETLPRGPLTAGEHLALRDLRAHWALLGATRALEADSGTDWAVSLQETAAPLPPPGTLRNVPLVPMRSQAELLERLADLRPILSTCAHAGLEGDLDALARATLAGGGSRVCALGSMQRPPIGWRHDGRGAIEGLLRYVDVESSST